MRDVASSLHHSLHPSETPPLLPIPLPAPSTSCRADIPEADTPPRKRLLLTTPDLGVRFRDTERRMMSALEMVNMRVSYQVDVRSRESSEFHTRHHDAQKDVQAVRAKLEAADDLAVQHIMRTQALEVEHALTHWRTLVAVPRLWGGKMAPKRSQQVNTRSQQHSPEQQPQPLTSQIPTPIMIDQGVSAALAARDATRNGVDSHTSGTGVRGSERVAREMETVFRISNCSMENQIKFSTCTLLAGALTWWNSHVMTVTHDVAYSMTGSDLRRR
ncbi:hypothetical protein Tco_1081580 [Tanacetum coccineum]|uniref:Reverse transcriptase domain-containing protein n=1 Tax=Tanacetum coccineum TaxID=301880 RepID=A0ABQ5HYC1_9ASTR